MKEKYQQGDVLFIKQDKMNTSEGWTITKKKDINNKISHIARPGEELKKNYHGNMHETGHANTDRKHSKLTVAHGEVTGHSHTFYMEKNIPGIGITSFGNRYTSVGKVPRYINIEHSKDEDVKARINHEEHNELELPTGFYQVRIVKEFDQISGTTRNVVD